MGNKHYLIIKLEREFTQMAYQRTEERKASDKTKGDNAELEFIHQMSFLGAFAQTSGRIPFDRKSCPRIQFPAKYSVTEQEVIYPRQVAPDVVFWWPEWPLVSMAQIKAKEIGGSVRDGSAFFWLDEEQLFKMNEVARSGANVIFVVYCTDLDAIPGLSALSFVNIRDLSEDKISLLKVRSAGKPTFQIPISVFNPISALKDHIRNETFPFARTADGGGSEDHPRYALAA